MLGSGCAAERREQAIVGRALQLDLRRLRSTGRLRERIRVLAGRDLRRDQQDGGLIAGRGYEPRVDRGGLAGVGGGVELADDARTELVLGAERVLDLVLRMRDRDRADRRSNDNRERKRRGRTVEDSGTSVGPVNFTRSGNIGLSRDGGRTIRGAPAQASHQPPALPGV